MKGNCLVGIRIYCGFREKCGMIKQKSICEANLEWIFACNYEGTE